MSESTRMMQRSWDRFQGRDKTRRPVDDESSSDEGGIATGSHSSAGSLGTPEGTHPTFGPEEHGMREEKQSH